MPDRQQEHEHRRGRKRRIGPGRTSSVWWPLAVVALIPIVLYTLYSVTEKSIRAYRVQYEAVLLEAEIEGLIDENIQLQRLVNEAKSDAEIEAAARAQGLARLGDVVVVLVGAAPPTRTPDAATRAAPIEPVPPWLLWLLDFFGG